jgi:hypothetical protein
MTQQLADNKVTVTKMLPTVAKELNSSGNKPSYYLNTSVKRHFE